MAGVLVGATAAVGAPASSATSPGTDGRIAFDSDLVPAPQTLRTVG